MRNIYYELSLELLDGLPAADGQPMDITELRRYAECLSDVLAHDIFTLLFLGAEVRTIRWDTAIATGNFMLPPIVDNAIQRGVTLAHGAYIQRFMDNTAQFNGLVWPSDDIRSRGVGMENVAICARNLFGVDVSNMTADQIQNLVRSFAFFAPPHWDAFRTVLFDTVLRFMHLSFNSPWVAITLATGNVNVAPTWVNYIRTNIDRFDRWPITRQINNRWDPVEPLHTHTQLSDFLGNLFTRMHSAWNSNDFVSILSMPLENLLLKVKYDSIYVTPFRHIFLDAPLVNHIFTNDLIRIENGKRTFLWNVSV